MITVTPETTHPGPVTGPGSAVGDADHMNGSPVREPDDPATLDLGDVLAVFAHPDDEAYGAAGLLALSVDRGRRVVCVTATRGEEGFALDDPRSPADRAAVRTAELAACLAVLGVTEHRWWDYPDGGCAGVPDDEAADRIVDLIHEVRPDTILTFSPDGGTGHPDHRAACRWTTLAVDRLAADPTAPRPRLLYATKSARWQADRAQMFDPAAIMMVADLQPEVTDETDLAVWLQCTGPLLTRKVAALREQRSQVGPLVDVLGVDGYRDLVADEFFRDRRPDDDARIEQARSWVARR